MFQKYAALISLLLIGLFVLVYAVLTTLYNENVVLPTQYAVRIIPNVVYGPMPDEVLDECLPVGAAVARPGLILIHGGGWFGGDKSQFAQECSSYAARGFVTVSTNYRLTTGGYRWPDQIGDAQLAVRFLRAHAVLLNLDPARICSFGGSAGSQLALLLDTSKSIHASDVAYLYPNISPAVNCAVDQFGPSDLVRLYDEPHTGRIDIQPLLNGQTPTSDPMIYADASPVDQVTTQTGPVLITQGTEDNVVLPDQSIELWAALQKANISGCYISYNGGHSYSGLTQARINAIQQQIADWLISVESP